MAKSLDQRLADAAGVVASCNGLLATRASDIPDGALDHFRKTLDLASGIPSWRELIVARNVAREFLDDLEQKADAGDLVPFGNGRAKFEHVRLIGVEAYLAISWSLADHVSAMAGRVLCTVSGGALGEPAPKLVSHFIEDDRSKTTASMLFDSVRHTFGWPIAVAYALRNLFVHDGAHKNAVSFFEGKTAAAAFKISARGWRQIEQKALKYGVQADYTRAGPAWPATPSDDLRAVFVACEREMDDAMGVLVGSACSAVAAHLGFVLGND